jgi:hypothetical protein
MRLDAVGSIESVVVGGRTAQLHLPRLQNGGPALEWPAVLDALSGGVVFSEDLTDELPESPWGYPNSWGMGYDTTELGIARVAIVFEATEPDVDLAFVKELANDVPRWFAHAADWCEVLYGQDLDHQSPRRHLHLEGDGWKLWYQGAMADVRGRIHFDFDRGQPLTRPQWVEVVGLVGAGTRPPLSALLLRDARNALARRNGRKAVADAATALEIALHAILLAVHRASPRPDTAEVVKKARRASLGVLVAELGRLGALPPGVDEPLVQLRNEVVHKTAKTPADEDAARLVSVATAACGVAWPTWPRPS